jgi:hypothetical protein
MIIIKTPNGWYSKGDDLLLENQIPQQQLTFNGYLVISKILGFFPINKRWWNCLMVWYLFLNIFFNKLVHYSVGI